MGRVNRYAFEIILRSFWQIESDPPGFKEIGNRKLGRFLQTIDARYNAMKGDFGKEEQEVKVKVGESGEGSLMYIEQTNDARCMEMIFFIALLVASLTS